MANYNNLISFIKNKEGGLSSATTDTASRNPSNCGNGSNGKPYHTNKGVQWITFKSFASQLGYTPSCENFLKMPDEIWGKIYKEQFWNPITKDKIKNQAIANTFVEWAWMSGIGGATSSLKNFFQSNYNKSFTHINQIIDYVNELDSKGQTSELFEKLYDFRQNRFKQLNQPANLKGWLNRLDAFYLLNKPYALPKFTDVVSKNKNTIYIILGLLAIGGAYYYVRARK